VHRNSPCCPAEEFVLAARNNRLLRWLVCASRNTIEHDLGIRMIPWPGTRAKVEPNVLPGITGFTLQTDCRRGFIAALDHAIFTSTIVRNATDDPVFVPIDFLLQLLKGPVVAVGNEVTGSFPALAVPGRYRPGRTSKLPKSRHEFQISRGPKKWIFLSPDCRSRKFFCDRSSRQEEIRGICSTSLGVTSFSAASRSN
jgi:hypothetical protein